MIRVELKQREQKTEIDSVVNPQDINKDQRRFTICNPHYSNCEDNETNLSQLTRRFVKPPQTAVNVNEKSGR